MYGYTYCYPTAPTYTAPAYGYGCAPTAGRGFALIVVLFILLIIVGAACIH
ncbi:YjcZ family sporulation protein [Ectobacillus sp. sgz5001026]|uniref:YjcZ family sporulation protein n=1 Tax=Ectobacillus sp. sgz5001026 TaxID=3242473 RepID=UPI0036D268EC